MRVELTQMLTKLYIDNYRCFVNFEYRPARSQLILGRNGSGKSSFLDALFLIRQFAVTGVSLEGFPLLNQRTRWMSQPRMTFELEAALKEGVFVYRAVIEPWGDVQAGKVASETVRLNGNPVFEFSDGEVHLYSDRFEHKVTFGADWGRSALQAVQRRKDNLLLSGFKDWLGRLMCFRINPYAVAPVAEAEQLAPSGDLSNFAAWYRHLIQAFPKENADFLESLRATMDGFQHLQLEAWGPTARVLRAELKGGGSSSLYGLNELSDGQRCLICLYAILHFVLAKGCTVILDEPDNFVSLREIQPWLMAVEELSEQQQGQVLLISHHPEIINQWAPGRGVLFTRDDCGPVRVQEFPSDPQSTLAPSELIARGWENE